jgi:hypothetical protein
MGDSIEFKCVIRPGTAVPTVLKTSSKDQDGKSICLGFEFITKVEYSS